MDRGIDVNQACQLWRDRIARANIWSVDEPTLPPRTVVAS